MGVNELIGNKFNRLTIIGLDHIGPNYQKFILVECECGNKKIIPLSAIKNGSSRSCGCLQKEIASSTLRNYLLKHGKSKSHPEYKVWKSMRSRCSDKKDKRYGGRGIRVCRRWGNFELFLKDVGHRPSKKHSLERIRVNGDYKPSNCRWATDYEQRRNKTDNVFLKLDGVIYVMQDFAKIIGVTPMAIVYRLKKYGKRRTLNHYKKVLKNECIK